MKRPCVEFYGTGPMGIYGWRLRAKNGQIILSPHETFVSHRNAVESFKRVCAALEGQGVYQIKDLEGVRGSVEMLTR